MNRFVVGAFAASSIALSLGACGDDSGRSYSGGGGGPSCEQLTTCGSCTPVQGCGWCFTASGGSCAPDPGECMGNEFSWTWDPSGCPDVDASVVPEEAGGVDAGTEAAVGVETGSDAIAASDVAAGGDGANGGGDAGGSHD